MHGLRPCSGRERVEVWIAEAIEQRLRDLAVPRVAVADEEDADRLASSVARHGPAASVASMLSSRSRSSISSRSSSSRCCEILRRCRSSVSVSPGSAARPWRQVSASRPASFGREAEPPEGEDHPQARAVGVGVLAVAVRPPLRWRQDARGLVPAHSGRGDPDTAGERRDVHWASVDPTATAKSSRIPRSGARLRRASAV